MTTTNHTSPSGEDSANGTIGEREAFEAWFKVRGVWPRLTYLEVWEAGRAALAAEKVAGQEPVGEVTATVLEGGAQGVIGWYGDPLPVNSLLYAAPQQPEKSAEQDERAAKVYVECRECVECGHCGINDSHPTDAACGYSCDWTGPSPVEDKCPGCGNENVMTSACPKCSGRYRYVAEATIQARAASTQPTATQTVQDERALTKLRSLLENEIAHSEFNDLRLAPDFGRVQGELAVRAASIQAFLDNPETASQPASGGEA
ncbi:UNVERIFIED_ORG: hypothetical protein ABIC54_004416 [Burkholderia sp. 1263]